MDKLERVDKLAELYQVVRKMQHWADMDNYGYSQEKNTILTKITDERMSLLEENVADELEVLENYSDQANLEWSSNPQRGIN